jgi:hypothetical protein
MFLECLLIGPIKVKYLLKMVSQQVLQAEAICECGCSLLPLQFLQFEEHLE